VAAELYDPEDPTGGRLVTKAIRFTSVKIEYPNGGFCAEPDDPVSIRIGYEAPEPTDDVVFAIHIHDLEGNFLLGVNTELMGIEIGKVHGRGEARFDLDRVPLLDGTYKVSLGIHNHDGGVEYDHREDQDVF